MGGARQDKHGQGARKHKPPEPLQPPAPSAGEGEGKEGDAGAWQDAADHNTLGRLGNWPATLVVFALGAACYLNSLDGPFLMDDTVSLRDNPDVQPTTPLRNLLSNDFWGLDITSHKSHKSYRPLTVLTFRLTHAASGSLEPRVYHVVNVGLHALVCALFHRVVRCVAGDVVAGMAAALFATHAIHTEAVANVTGQAELLSGVFFCVAVLLYMHACGHDGTRWASLVLSCVAVGAAMLSKEQGVTAAGVCLVYDLITHALPQSALALAPHRMVAACVAHARTPPFLRFLKRAAVVALCVVALLWWRVQVMGGSPPKMPKVNNPVSYNNDTLTHVLTHNYVWSYNCWLLLLPKDLSCDYQYSAVPLVESLQDPRNLCSAAMWMGLCVVLWLLRHQPRQAYAALALGVLPFLPASNLFFYVGFVIAERVLYLPSMGFCMLVPLVMRRLRLGEQAKGAMMACFVLYVAWNARRTVERNEDWGDGVALFRSSRDALPGNEYLWWGMAQHMDIDDPEKEKLLQHSLTINPEFDKSFLDLAEIYRHRGDFEKAIEYAKTGVTLPTVMLQLWTKMMNILADVWFQQQQYALVVNACNHVLKRDPDNSEAMMHQANALWATNNGEAAETLYKEVLKRDPSRSGAYNNLGVVFQQSGRLREALALYQQGSTVPGVERDKAFWNSYGALLCKMNQYKEAVRVYNRALAIDPHYKEALHGRSYAQNRVKLG